MTNKKTENTKHEVCSHCKDRRTLEDVVETAHELNVSKGAKKHGR